MQVTRKITNSNGESVLLGFEWQGGPYIEICRDQAYRSPQEVINVWNYGSNSSRIPYTPEALAVAVNDWIGEYGRDQLYHDVIVNWRR